MPPPPIFPHDAVTERIVLGHDSLPTPELSARVGAAIERRRAGETYQQMYRIVDDLRKLREQRNVALRTARAAQRASIHRLILITGRREAGGVEHCLRVGALSALLAANLGKPADWCNMLFHAAAVHDLGNLSIPDAILHKTSRLTAQEWRIVRDHPIAGAALLRGGNSPIEALAAEVALNHHEKWDGSGYPAGRQGTNIPLGGRIVAVADFVDSLASASAYRDALPDEEIFHLLRLASGAQFDPRVAHAMDRLRPRLADIRIRAAEWASKLATTLDCTMWWHDV